jgi:hypothetical protein
LDHHTIWDYPEYSDLALRPGRLDARAKSRKHVPLTDREITVFAQAILNVEDELWELTKTMLEIEKKPPTPLFGTLFEPKADPQPPVDAPPHNSDKAP